ncbi:MAG: hypothetical protein K9N55_08410 [Phycisphaerae bacterium]|nr:hypothetical protein [Phycisphaerae bacterium]
MHRRFMMGLLSLMSVGLIAAVVYFKPAYQEPITEYESVDRPAHLQPDYSHAVIPPNIAPLNFSILEPGLLYCARIFSAQGEPIEIFSQKSCIQIPQAAWHNLLKNNVGQALHMDIFVKREDHQWRRFQTISHEIAREAIDGFLVYRKMHPTHLRVKGRIGIYCRDLSNYKESIVLDGMSYENGCVNCHSFCQQNPDNMLLGARSDKYGVGTLLVEDGVARKIDTKFGYTSWHPSARLAVYSINKLPMFYHSSRNEPRDTVDLNSLLACYHNDTKTVVIEPKLAQKEYLENWPVWSGDGKYLYFCRAPKPWSDDTPSPPAQFDQIKYDLVRIAYDLQTNTWGDIEIVLSSRETGKSVGMPRCSPDGRWLTFCLFDYGYLPTWQENSDLYLMDLKTSGDAVPGYRRLEINSPKSESWLTWSSNSRWIVFSSKRLHGVFTRLFISYVDQRGKVHKPVVLPQQDPTFYESCLLSFNTAELVIKAPHVTGERLAKVFRSKEKISVRMPITMATPKAADAQSYSERE